jgi:SAM-dependent methyltransferase
MAHLAQQEFCLRVKALFPEMFTRKRVLDCGSLDINGSNRDYFTDCAYVGLDVGPGKNVDVVSPMHLHEDSSGFDTIISTECFEHDRHYRESFRRIVELLKPGGLFFFSCASTGRPEHGTARCLPNDSPLTVVLSEWAHYYKNLTEADIREAIDIPATFGDRFHFEYNQSAGDLYFWGVKHP